MSTRGVFGFRVCGTDYLARSNYDSYPFGRGLRNLLSLRGYFYGDGGKPKIDWGAISAEAACLEASKRLDALRRRVMNLTIIPEEECLVSGEDLEALKLSGLLTQIPHRQPTWRETLLEVEGYFHPYLTGQLNYIVLNNEFIKNSLFCEWGYVLNLDLCIFEVWRGFQRTGEPSNRYGQSSQDGYFPCKRIKWYRVYGELLEKGSLDTMLPSPEKFLEDMKEFE